MQRARWGVVAVVGMISFATTAWTQEPAAQSHPRIVSGVQTFDYPEVGMLIAETAGGSASCTGTMIGCNTFVTAAHCVCEGGLSATECKSSLSDPKNLHVYLPSGGIFTGASVKVQKDYKFATGGDIAVIKLTESVSGVIPARINTIGRPEAGSVGQLVGYGRDGKNFIAGIKRTGKVSFSACELVPDANNLCWHFTEPVAPPGQDSNTCNGDSGGPVFVDLGDGERLAGVTSGGVDCHPPDLSFDTDVYVYRDFVIGEAGDDLANWRCGSIPQVGETGTVVETHSGRLTGEQRNRRFSVVVPEHTRELRVGVNGETNNGYVVNDFDLALRHEAVATLEDFDCKDESPLALGYCRIENPRAGTWNILVHATEGFGKFQLTVSTFATDNSTTTVSCARAASAPSLTELLADVDRLLVQPPVAAEPNGSLSIEDLVLAAGGEQACNPGF